MNLSFLSIDGRFQNSISLTEMDFDETWTQLVATNYCCSKSENFPYFAKTGSSFEISVITEKVLIKQKKLTEISQTFVYFSQNLKPLLISAILTKQELCA